MQVSDAASTSAQPVADPLGTISDGIAPPGRLHEPAIVNSVLPELPTTIQLDPNSKEYAVTTLAFVSEQMEEALRCINNSIARGHEAVD